MRKLVLVAIVISVVFAPASSAQLDPAALVLKKSDLPRGYSVLRANTGYLPNRKAAQGAPDLIRDYAAWGRFTGYAAEYDGGIKGHVASRVDFFRRSDGATKFLGWQVQVSPQRTGVPLVRRASVLGNQAFVFRKDYGSTVFFVVDWRFRNVAAEVSTDSAGLQRTLALARVQQRRIAAALA